MNAGDTIFRVVAAESDLPASSTPLSIAQDGTGFIWIATETGVNRWDGRSFKTFTADGRSGALPEHSAKVVATDIEGRIWIGMSSEGLLRFDPATETFARPHNRTPLDRERIAALAPRRNGTIWVASHGGVSIVDPRTMRTNYQAGVRLGLPAGSASSVAEDSQGRLRAVLGGKLFVQDESEGRMRLVDLKGSVGHAEPAAAGTTLLVDGSDRIWVSHHFLRDHRARRRRANNPSSEAPLGRSGRRATDDHDRY